MHEQQQQQQLNRHGRRTTRLLVVLNLICSLMGIESVDVSMMWELFIPDLVNSSNNYNCEGDGDGRVEVWERWRLIECERSSYGWELNVQH